jgi:AcrR family transcriptional regulator
MADVARRAFEQFEARLKQAWAGGTPDPLSAFERLGRAYLAFAREEPAQYSAMFESGLSFRAFPDLHVAGDRAFDVLRDACAALIATMPEARRPPVTMMALHIWAQSHGIASLFARGDEARRPIPMTPEDLLDAAVLIYLDGLGVRPGKGVDKNG